MIENLIAGAMLVALGTLGAWQFSPAPLVTLAAVALIAWGACRVLNAFRGLR